jgi:DNA-binding CsgD family transcriptional regulator
MARLTQSELDVVRLVADVMRNQEIALQLNVAEHTLSDSHIRQTGHLQSRGTGSLCLQRR